MNCAVRIEVPAEHLISSLPPSLRDTSLYEKEAVDGIMLAGIHHKDGGFP